jgi:hypothetical protein
VALISVDPRTGEKSWHSCGGRSYKRDAVQPSSSRCGGTWLDLQAVRVSAARSRKPRRPDRA